MKLKTLIIKHANIVNCITIIVKRKWPIIMLKLFKNQLLSLPFP